MFRTAITIALSLSAASAMAQASPVGLWRTIADDGKTAKSEVRIVEANGVVSGKIEKLLDPAAQNDKCDKCDDDRKDKPIVGMEILRGLKKVDGKEVWEGGKILDPSNGKQYNARLTPIEGGKRLEMRGSIAFIGRTQTWVRID